MRDVEVWDSVMQQWLPWPDQTPPQDRWRRYTVRGTRVTAPPVGFVKRAVQ